MWNCDHNKRSVLEFLTETPIELCPSTLGWFKNKNYQKIMGYQCSKGLILFSEKKKMSREIWPMEAMW